MLQWAYYVDWPDATAVLNIGTEIVTLMHLAIAVDKVSHGSLRSHNPSVAASNMLQYDLKKMSDLTLARAQILIDGLRYSKQCMQLIRDFSAAKAVNGSILAKLAVRLEQLIEAESSRQQEGISLLRKEIKFGIRAEDLRGKTV